MQEKKFEARINEQGCIEVPISVLNDLMLNLGDTLQLQYQKPTEAIEKCMLIESKGSEDSLDMFLCIPKIVLEDCGLSTDNNDIHILCFDKEITITTNEKIISEVPRAVLNICQKLGISERMLAKAVAEECSNYEN